MLSLGGSALGFPLFLGLRRIWTVGCFGPNRDSVQTIVVLCLSAWVVSFFVYGALDGGILGSNAIHVPYLMWAAFLFPVGWAGLCVLLAEGPSRWITASFMLMLLGFGITSTIEDFRPLPYYLGSRRAEFSPGQVDELQRACRGQKVGYFANEQSQELVENWWYPEQLVWAVMADFKLLRLNQTEADKVVRDRKAVWRQAAPGVYARMLGLEWNNDAATILGFARVHGIEIIAESQGYPIPPDIRSHLKVLQRAGPFTLYRIPQSAEDRTGDRQH